MTIREYKRWWSCTNGKWSDNNTSVTCPPMGVIDGSVLTAVGLLLMFAVVGKLPEAIKAGRSIKIRKDDISVELSGKETKSNDGFLPTNT